MKKSFLPTLTGLVVLFSGIGLNTQLSCMEMEKEMPLLESKLSRAQRSLSYNFDVSKVLCTLESRIESVAFSPVSKTVLTGSEDGKAYLWDLEGKQLQIFRGHRRPVRGREHLALLMRLFLQDYMDGTARLWDAQQENSLRNSRAHYNRVVCPQ